MTQVRAMLIAGGLVLAIYLVGCLRGRAKLTLNGVILAIIAGGALINPFGLCMVLWQGGETLKLTAQVGLSIVAGLAALAYLAIKHVAELWAVAVSSELPPQLPPPGDAPER